MAACLLWVRYWALNFMLIGLCYPYLTRVLVKSLVPQPSQVWAGPFLCRHSGFAGGNWPVETTSARELTFESFKRQAANDNLSRADALRQSMHALIEGPRLVDPKSGNTIFYYAHPIFWTPFSLVGAGGG